MRITLQYHPSEEIAHRQGIDRNHKGRSHHWRPCSSVLAEEDIMIISPHLDTIQKQPKNHFSGCFYSDLSIIPPPLGKTVLSEGCSRFSSRREG